MNKIVKNSKLFSGGLFQNFRFKLLIDSHSHTFFAFHMKIEVKSLKCCNYAFDNQLGTFQVSLNRLNICKLFKKSLFHLKIYF